MVLGCELRQPVIKDCGNVEIHGHTPWYETVTRVGCLIPAWTVTAGQSSEASHHDRQGSPLNQT